MQSALDARAGATVTGVFLGGLAIAGAVALVTAPITPRLAVAQTVVKTDGRQAARVFTPGTDGLKSVGSVADRLTGPVRLLNVTAASTPSGGGKGGRVDALDRVLSNDGRD